MRILRAIEGLLVVSVLFGCATLVGCSTADEPAPDDPPEEGPAGTPEVIEEHLKIYITYAPQVQRRNFNGVFDLDASRARIVRTFWKERFNELTRPDHYG